MSFLIIAFVVLFGIVIWACLLAGLIMMIDHINYRRRQRNF